MSTVCIPYSIHLYALPNIYIDDLDSHVNRRSNTLETLKDWTNVHSSIRIVYPCRSSLIRRAARKSRKKPRLMKLSWNRHYTHIGYHIVTTTELLAQSLSLWTTGHFVCQWLFRQLLTEKNMHKTPCSEYKRLISNSLTFFMQILLNKNEKSIVYVMLQKTYSSYVNKPNRYFFCKKN